MAMMRMFVSEWQGFVGTVHASQVEVLTLPDMLDSVAGGHGTRTVEPARL